MAKKKQFVINDKILGILIFVGLIIEYVLPRANITFLSGIAVVIYLLVAIYLILFGDK